MNNVALVVLLIAVAIGAVPLYKIYTQQSQQPTSTTADKMAQQPAPDRSALREATVAIVGGGLAGLAAALEAHEEAMKAGLPLRLVLVEKMPSVGGNSAKASSGMNALNVPAGDSEDLFQSDTLASGGGLSDADLVSNLVKQSQAALEFLQAAGADLSKYTQLGGHSAPRSFFNAVGPNVGLAIIQALSRKVQQLPDIRILTHTKAEEIVVHDGRVAGLKVNKAQGGDGSGHEVIACDAIILATGGFGANKSLLELHNPAAAALATTNGDWAQGEALAMAKAVGADLIHLEYVQVHPTGFVDPKDPDAGTKWLAPEKFRGVGALLLNTEGRRFVDELSTRDVVSAAMMRESGKKAFLLLGASAAADFGLRTIGFYNSKGMMNKAETLQDLATAMQVPQDILESELTAYNEAVESKVDKFRKKVFPHQHELSGPFQYGLVEPVVHYTMGGVHINSHAQALRSDGQPILGLYAAGEVSGGVHGKNRLGGNSLLECCVFGRIAGKESVTFAGQLSASAV